MIPLASRVFLNGNVVRAGLRVRHDRAHHAATRDAGMNAARRHPKTARHREIAQRYRRGNRPVSKLERILALRRTQLARPFEYRGGLHDDSDGPQAGPWRYLARFQEARSGP